MDNQELENLITQCIEIANSAWWKVYSGGWNSGDCNRQAVGQLASVLLEYRLKNEK